MKQTPLATIFISQIAFEGRHGVTAAERAGTRHFEVDVELDAPVEAAERSDRLADTIDYTEVSEIIVRLGTGEPHHLLESLARAMCTTLSARFPAATIRLELRKFQPPGCPGHPAFAAVRLQHP